MREIGRVKLVQIQRRSLKFGERPQRYYDPSPLLVVEALQVTSKGCIGLTEESESILDKHHSEHPDSGYSGNNGVSLGFTGHYALMRREFGEHLVDGCAGENILIDSELQYPQSGPQNAEKNIQPPNALSPQGVYAEKPKRFSGFALGERVWIESAATGERVVLNEIVSAAPCVEFSCYAIDHGRSAYNPEIAKGYIKRTLQFLSDGVRGFYASVEQGKGEGVIRVGDRVYVGDQGD